MRALIVEDEQKLSSILSDILAENNFSVSAAYNGVAGLDEAASGVYDIIILDVMLPGMNGFDVVKKLREAGVHTPVLMLTARGETADRVTGLDCGADYYLVKPFEMTEFLACVRALLRRPGEVQMDGIAFGDLALHPSNLSACCGTRSIRLTAREFDILRLLALSKGGIVPKETLLVKVWGYDAEVDDSSVEVYMSFLRKKLSHIQSRTQIKAVRKAGYHLQYGERA